MKAETLKQAKAIARSLRICTDRDVGCEGCIFYRGLGALRRCEGSGVNLERRALELFEKIMEEEAEEHGQGEA